MVILLCVSLTAHAWQFNGIAPGGTGGTPFAVGSTTPVAVSTCAAASNPRFYMDWQVSGGTAGTDGCYAQPAAIASPCAAASPAPSSATKTGYALPSGGSFPQHTVINWLEAGGGNIFASEWDVVCTGAETVSVTTIP
jgi:hypothetical protein